MTRRARQSRRAPGGFSLLEVMLAIAVVLALAGILYAFLFDLMDSRAQVERHSDRARAGIGAIEQIERDVMTTLAGGSQQGSGVQGGPHSITLLSRSVTLPFEDQSQAVLGDLQGVSYSWDGHTGQLKASRWDVLQGEQPRPEVVSDQVAYLQIRYYDGKAWRGQFDSSQGLPVAIEIALWYGKPELAGEMSGSAPEPAEFAPAPVGGVQPDRGVETGSESEASAASAQLGDDAQPMVPTRAPDRVRVMVVPDGPSVGWGGRS